eukprot:UN32218
MKLFEEITTKRSDYSVLHLGDYLFGNEIQNIHEDACYILGLIHLHLRNFQETRKMYEKALTINSDDFAIHNNLADLCCDHLEEYKEARIHYQKAIAINPKSDVSHNNLANLLKTHFKDYEAAKFHYLEELRLCPDCIGHFNLADLLANYLNDFQEAKEHYKKSLEYDPADICCLMQYADLLEEHFKDFGEAENCLLKVLKIQKNNPAAYNNLGILYENMQDFDRAHNSYLKALEIDPNYAVAHHNVGYTFELQNKYEEAKKHYLLALRDHPDYYLRFQLSELLIEHFDDFDGSREQLELALIEAADSKSKKESDLTTVLQSIFAKLTTLFKTNEAHFLKTQYAHWFDYLKHLETEDSASKWFLHTAVNSDDTCVRWFMLPECFRKRVEMNFSNIYQSIIEKVDKRKDSLKLVLDGLLWEILPFQIQGIIIAFTNCGVENTAVNDKKFDHDQEDTKRISETNHR